MYILVVMIIAACLAFLPASIAKRKGKDFTIWYIYGFFIWIVAIFHAISLPELSDDSSRAASNSQSNSSCKKMNIDTLENKEVDLNAPVENISNEVLSNDRGQSFFNIRLRNLNIGTLTAIKLEIKGFNSFEEIIKIDNKESFICLLQDLDVPIQSEFSNYAPILLPNNAIRRLSIIVKQVRFSDNKMFDNDTPYIVNNEYDEIYNQDELQFLRRYVSGAICYAEQKDNIWRCVCGRLNHNNQEVCVRCNTSKVYSFMELSEDKIRKKIKIKLKENLDKKSKAKKIRMVMASIILLSVLSILTTNRLIKLVKYNQGISLIYQGKYDSALAVFDGLEDFKCSEVYLRFCLEYGLNHLYVPPENIIFDSPGYSVADGWIYMTGVWRGSFFNRPGIYKVKCDGTDMQKISKDVAQVLTYYNGWVYYTINEDYESIDGDEALYRVKDDGSKKETYIEGTVHSSYFIIDNTIFYIDEVYESNGEEKGNLIKMNMDTLEKQIFDTNGVSDIIQVRDDWVYYSKYYPWTDIEGETIFKIRIDGTERVELSNAASQVISYDVHDNTIYYTTSDYNYLTEEFYTGFYKIDMVTGTSEHVTDIDNAYIIAVNNYGIFYDSYALDDIVGTHRIDFDGSNDVIVGGDNYR